MTRRAFWFVLVLMTALVVALSTGAQVYYLIVLAMGIMLIVSLASCLLALATVKARVDCPRRSVERGVSVPIVAAVRHSGLLPVKSIALKLAIPDDGGSLDAIELTAPPFRERRYEVLIACPHRGVYDIGVTQIAVTDVFALFTFSRKMRENQFRVEVMPRHHKLPPLDMISGDNEDNRIARMTEDAASPADVRQWQSGDALKKVHWKLSMRKRELMVRTYEESARPDMLVLVDLYPSGSLRSHQLTVEDAVAETAASIVGAQLRASYPVRMPLMSAQPTEIFSDHEGGLGQFLYALTRVKFDSPYPFEKVLMLEMRRMQRTAGAVLVTPRLTARIADLAIQMARSGMNVSVCWVTDNRHDEALELISRIKAMGAQAYRIDPWGDGLTAEQMMKQVQYGA